MSLLFATLTLQACAEEAFTVKYAPNFSPTRKHISVFGIKRDGLMSRSGWAALGPGLSAPFSAHPCDVAYSEEVFTAAPALASLVDDYVRSNGVTDELLEQLAPAAKGDTIMLVTIAGHAVLPTRDLGGASTMPPGRSSMGGGRGRRGYGGGARTGSDQTRETSNHDPFEVSAFFFSVPERRAVGVVKMSYSGSNTEQALSQFTHRLEVEFPGSTCSGWDWSVQLDTASLRALREQ
jgi:hypothetical protein